MLNIYPFFFFFFTVEKLLLSQVIITSQDLRRKIEHTKKYIATLSSFFVCVVADNILYTKLDIAITSQISFVTFKLQHSFFSPFSHPQKAKAAWLQLTQRFQFYSENSESPNVSFKKI